MPLEYVISKTGTLLLVVDRYIFQKQSTNPNTGRISWRCSKRRNKDISCSSSCHSNNNEILSGPTPHDPACHPLTSAEFMIFDKRREKLNASQMENNPYHPNNTANNDCTISQIFDDSYNGDSLQNNHTDFDEEEAICNELTKFNEVDQDGEEDGPGVVDINYENNQNLYKNNDNNEESENLSQYDDAQESADSVARREVPTSDMGNNWINGVNNSISGNETSISSPMLKKNVDNLKFVTSKSGHPMLVFDGHTFHKHSVIKTGRINWRCSRRRTNNIKCSSSCFTHNGQFSKPTPHSVNCLPNHEPDSSQKAYTNDTNGCDDTYEDYNNTTYNEKSFLENANATNNINDQSFDEQSYYENGNVTNTNEEHFLDPNSDNQVNDEEEGFPFPNEKKMNAIQNDKTFKEYDLNNCSSEAFASLIKDMDEMKHRERCYREKLAKNREELENMKGIARKRLQQLKWKARMSEIDMVTLKATLNYTNRENSELRRLVDEMMKKFI